MHCEQGLIRTSGHPTATVRVKIVLLKSSCRLYQGSNYPLISHQLAMRETRGPETINAVISPGNHTHTRLQIPLTIRHKWQYLHSLFSSVCAHIPVDCFIGQQRLRDCTQPRASKQELPNPPHFADQAARFSVNHTPPHVPARYWQRSISSFLHKIVARDLYGSFLEDYGTVYP